MAKLSKREIRKLKESLTLPAKPAWERMSSSQRKEALALSEEYKRFLDAAKTERMAVKAVAETAAEAGFKPLPKGRGKWIVTWREKVVALVVRGKSPLTEGLRIVAAHLDAPRVDLKVRPLYEHEGLAFLKTQYYGGIRKHQWLARPMAIHGVVCTAEGKRIEIHLGEGDEEPVFTFLDLLPHLAYKQAEKKLSQAFEGERMNLLVGGVGLDGAESEGVKLGVLKLLHERYGITEADLVSAELEIVPAGRARDVGLDRSMVGGYGQDDRICVFCALHALTRLKTQPHHWAVALFVDKEEIGSDGATGAKSRWVEELVGSLLELEGGAGYMQIRRALAASQAISADVTAALDPDYPEVHDGRNAARLGWGVAVNKYTGSRGKYSANDADAEYLGWLRGVWEKAGVIWQAGAMGKVDEGGGGTIAKYLAALGMEIVDAGPALLSMHSPFEISHKADVYWTARAYQAFFSAGGR